MLKKLAFTAIVLGVVFVAGELAARIYLFGVRGWSHFDCDRRFEFDHYLTYANAPGFDRLGERHNNLGFKRTADTTREKPPGTLRIFVLGGSAAYGTGGLYWGFYDEHRVIPNDQTIDAHLERALHKAFPGARFEVINAAATGYWTHHHLLNYLTRLQHLQPDMLICIDGWNDFRRQPQYHAHPYRDNHVKPVRYPGPSGILEVGVYWLSRYSLLIRKAGQLALEALHARHVENLAPDSFGDRAGHVWSREADARAALREDFRSSQGWERAYRQLLQLCKQSGVDLVLARQPVLDLRDRASLTPIEQKLFDHTRTLKKMTQERQLNWEVAHELLLALAADGATYVDLHEDVKSSREQIFTDYCHITPRGGAVIADILLRRIEPAIRRRLGR